MAKGKKINKILRLAFEKSQQGEDHFSACPLKRLYFFKEACARLPVRVDEREKESERKTLVSEGDEPVR